MADRAEEYPEHFRDRVVPELRQVDGFLGALLLVRQDDAVVEFTVLTRWASISAISHFAGPDPERAVVEPEVVACLAGFDTRVVHYEVIRLVE